MALSIKINVEAQQHGQHTDVDFLFGSHREKCSLPLNFWSLTDYLSQWIFTLTQAIDLKTSGAMVTTVNDPSIAANLVAWVLYPLSDGSVKIQQHLVFPDQFKRNQKSIRDIVVRPRETVSEDGETISEWTVSAIDLPGAREELLYLMGKIENE